MQPRIILLSGPIGSGKTTLSNQLSTKHGFVVLKTRELIRSHLGSKELDRSELQAAGDSLDIDTKGLWIASALARQKDIQNKTFIIDSIRIEDQITGIRDGFGSRVVHLHLTAPSKVLELRYKERSAESRTTPFEQARANSTEANVDKLSSEADLVIDTQRTSSQDVYVRVASFLGLYGRSPERLVDVLVGGQYGSEGKGQVAAYLAPEYDILIRSGGPNAGHKVFEEPKPYTFHHLPSGTRCSEAKVILAPGAVLRVPNLLKEISDCITTSERLYIDPQAMVIEDEDLSSESTLQETIGSTGQGVGAATSRKVQRTAALPRVRLAREIKDLKPYLKPTREILDDAFSKGLRIFLEGTQGSGLSLHHGHYPYVTSRDTTVSGALAEAGIAPSRVRRTLLICRTYPIRVGSINGEKISGPMTNEITLSDIAQRSGMSLAELEQTEVTSTTNRPRRIGEFDWELFRQSVSLNGPTDVVLTFADYLAKKNQEARRFDQLTPETIQFIEELERVSAAPVSLIATRFHSRSIIDRRIWKRE